MHLNRLHTTLVNAGIPISGLSLGDDNLTVHYLDTATDAHKQQAQAIIDNFDNRVYRPRKLEDIAHEFAALPEAQQKHILSRVVAIALAQQPNLLHGSGVDIRTDEVATD